MLKSIKISLISLIFSLCFSMVISYASSNGYGILTLIGVDLPSFGKTVLTTDQVVKENDYVAQSYLNIGTVATYGGDKVKVRVRTENQNNSNTSLYLTLDTNETKTWSATTQNANYFKGTYKLRFRTDGSLVWGANHSGMWYYDVNP